MLYINLNRGINSLLLDTGLKMEAVLQEGTVHTREGQ